MGQVHCLCGAALSIGQGPAAWRSVCLTCGRAVLLVAGGGEIDARLTVRTGATGMQIFLRGDGPISIGKLEGSTIQLSGALVSRRHAKLIRSDGGWTLADEGSTN